MKPGELKMAFLDMDLASLEMNSTEILKEGFSYSRTMDGLKLNLHGHRFNLSTHGLFGLFP